MIFEPVSPNSDLLRGGLALDDHAHRAASSSSTVEGVGRPSRARTSRQWPSASVIGLGFEAAARRP